MDLTNDLTTLFDLTIHGVYYLGHGVYNLGMEWMTLAWSG